jgi:hypothetical protein
LKGSQTNEKKEDYCIGNKKRVGFGEKQVDGLENWQRTFTLTVKHFPGSYHRRLTQNC